MPVFVAELSKEEKKKIEDIKQNMQCKTDYDLIKHLVNNWWIEPGDIAAVNATTLKSWLPIWLDNIRDNLPEIWRGRDIEELFPDQEKFEGHAVIIGGGPSLELNGRRQLKLIVEKYRGTVICVDKTFNMALEEGINPDYTPTLDANPIVASWFKLSNKALRNYKRKTRFIAITSIHPETVKAIPGEKYWFNGGIDERMMPNVSQVIRVLTKKTEMNPGFNTGCYSWILSTALKIKDVAMIGMEHAYPAGTKIKQTQKFKSRVQIVGGKIIEKPDGDFDIEFPCSTCTKACEPPKECMDQIYGFYFKGHNNFFNTDYLSDGGWSVMAETFKKLFNHYKKEVKKETGDEITLTNCSPGILHGDGIEQDYLENWLRKHG